MNVLVADDDGFARLMLTSALQRLGHQVHEAENGRQALQSWEEHRQPLIISDWMMPDLDGLELCREVCANTGPDFNYLILLTARAGKENYLEAMEAGADDFVAKPFDLAQLTARVRVAERLLRLHENLRVANAELELRVAERTAELERALEAKSDFLSRASHELRTPMNHMLGFAQLLTKGDLGPREQASAEQILTSGRRLLVLIDRLLEVSKSEPDDLSFLASSTSASDSHLAAADR